jgi:cell wall-associated NlpC family hydrolase
MKTGDLLLFNYRARGLFGDFTSMIKWGTHSNYSHIAMVLKDPTFLHPHLKGTYVWESSWEGSPDPQDGERKLGVQITPIGEILDEYKKTKGHVYLRSIETDLNLFTDKNLAKVHEVVYKKPYDICPADWLEAFLQKDHEPQKTGRFWCSALVGYIYTQCGVLRADTDWSIMRPNDLSLDGEKLNFNPGVKLSNTETRIF